MVKHSKQRFSLRDWLGVNRHAYWTISIIFIVFFYLLPEALIIDNYHPTQCTFDSLIPFVPAFVYAYMLWFPLIFCMGFWLLLRDGMGYRRYMVFLIVVYTVSTVIYLIFPNGQDLRPSELEAAGLSNGILSLIYSVDTNTNVMPSLHVIGSIGVIASACTTPSIRSKVVRIGIIALAVLVSISTVFVKQHAIVDVIAGALVGALGWGIVWLIFRKK